MADPVREFELDAYIDGELTLPRRLAVEDQLSRDPAAAARLMADLRIRTALRLIHEPREAPPPGQLEAAARLQRRLLAGSPRRWLPLVGRWSAAAAVLAAFALVAVPQRQVSASPPSYVSEALMAYRTGLLRQGDGLVRRKPRLRSRRGPPPDADPRPPAAGRLARHGRPAVSGGGRARRSS